MICLRFRFLLLACGGLLALPALPAAREFILESRSSGRLLSAAYPTGNVRIELTVNYRTPGTVFDTVGINAAPAGSFSCAIDAEGRLSFQVYEPGKTSDARVPNGWHIVRAASLIKPDSRHAVRIDVRAASIELSIDGVLERTVTLGAVLSGQPLYLGDFPGDDQWGSKYNIHPAMTGSVSLDYLGAIPAGEPPPPRTRGESPPVPTDSPQVVDAGVRAIEQAFRAGKMDLIAQLTVPARRAEYRAIFAAHKTELPRVAALLRTRKLVATSGAAAEFQVTQGERVFSVFFERFDGVWRLARL